MNRCSVASCDIPLGIPEQPTVSAHNLHDVLAKTRRERERVGERLVFLFAVRRHGEGEFLDKNARNSLLLVTRWCESDMDGWCVTRHATQ